MIHKLTDSKYEMIVDYSVKDSLKSFKEEVLDELYKIHQQQGEMPVLYSGGMDSTFILRCLQELGISIRTVSFSFSKDNSDHDCTLVKNKCKKYGVKDPEFFYFEKEKFFNHLFFLVNEKNITYPMPHGYLMDHFLTEIPLRKYHTGLQAEFKYKGGRVMMPPGPVMIKTNHPDRLFTFTSDRTFLSYFKNSLFVNNHKKFNPYIPDRGEDVWFIRDLIYQECFPDMVKEEKLKYPVWRDYLMLPFYNVIEPSLGKRKNYVIPPCYFSGEFLVKMVSS